MASVRVLFVEDEDLIRLIMKEFLQENGFEAVEVWNGEEAVRLLDGPDGFDVLFTDVQMPGALDGIAPAEQARRRCPEIPVLVVSGYAENLVSRLRNLDPPAVLMSKPYDLAVVADTLRRLTGRL
ncbi:response regulator [Roseomonas nepalensis]|uniref:Response regulator n=1 Tax=Muricoccus nepalensis TaxID=1854500 RepID=A0A502F9I6_9PROT|nr:response regulator [Roseomonas nepalensis]TPG46055.1 response regulator [Roseomonas nepalensis]